MAHTSIFNMTFGLRNHLSNSLFLTSLSFFGMISNSFCPLIMDGSKLSTSKYCYYIGRRISNNITQLERKTFCQKKIVGIPPYQFFFNILISIKMLLVFILIIEISNGEILPYTYLNEFVCTTFSRIIKLPR